MSRVTSHHFDNLHPAMRAGRRSRSLDHFGYVPQGRVKTQSIVRAGYVFVDRLRNSDHAYTQLSQPRRHAECVFTSARHDCIKTECLDVFNYFPRTIFKATVFGRVPEWIGPRGTEIRSAIAIPTPHRCTIQWQDLWQGVHQAS